MGDSMKVVCPTCHGAGEHKHDCPLIKAPCGCTPLRICDQHRCNGLAMDGSRCIYRSGHSWNCES